MYNLKCLLDLKLLLRVNHFMSLTRLMYVILEIYVITKKSFHVNYRLNFDYMRKTTTRSITFKKTVTIKNNIINMLSFMGF